MVIRVVLGDYTFDTYLLRRRRQLDDPESAVPSDSEIATFVLVAGTVSPYIPKENPCAIKKHKPTSRFSIV